jgi:glycosyltransferase involved in cell wall biosynthesis
MNANKIFFITNHRSFFLSHIFQHANKLRRKDNFSVELICGRDASSIMRSIATKKLNFEKIKLRQFNFHPTSINPILDFKAFYQILFFLKKKKPKILHVATPKGIVFGGFAGLFLGLPTIIFFSGMGFFFLQDLKFKYKLIKYFYFFLLRIIFFNKKKYIIVENKDDFNFFHKKFAINKSRLFLIKGSGVLAKSFIKNKINLKKKTILFPGRVLRDKGIVEFLTAANNLVREFPKWKFIVAGTLDYKKNSNIDQENILKLNFNNAVKFIGYQKNMVRIYKNSTFVCLPSYREGLSKALSEAAMSGLPIITSKAPGCKESIINKFTGELVIASSVVSLTNKIRKFILNKKLLIRYGKNAKIFAKNNFDNLLIFSDIKKIYLKIIEDEKINIDRT